MHFVEVISTIVSAQIRNKLCACLNNDYLNKISLEDGPTDYNSFKTSGQLKNFAFKYKTYLVYSNFQIIEVVSRYRDPQLQVAENYPYP